MIQRIVRVTTLSREVEVAPSELGLENCEIRVLIDEDSFFGEMQIFIRKSGDGQSTQSTDVIERRNMAALRVLSIIILEH